MQAKSFLVTVGLSMAAGAAAILMLPKSSPIYQAADDAASTIKQGASQWIDQMS